MNDIQNNLLITQGLSPFAQRVSKCFEDTKVIFASGDPIPEVLLKNGKYRQIPAVTHPSFVHELLKCALDVQATQVLPLGREEVFALSSVRPLFDEYGVQLLVPKYTLLAELEILENPPPQFDLDIRTKGDR